MTHNLSTIRDVDKIIVISDGIVVEEGTHDELMSKKSHYYHLINVQNASYNLFPVIQDKDEEEKSSNENKVSSVRLNENEVI